MAHLNETGQALFELRAAEPYSMGMHLGEQLSVGDLGVKVGEVPFDPSLHEPSDIDRMSMMGRVRGRPYVAQIVPFRPEEANVVLHNDPADQAWSGYLAPMWDYKRGLAVSLSDAISDAKQMGDTGTVYVVGDTTRQTGLRHADYVRNTETPEKAADAIADICRRGLTFVISDFEALPLDRAPAGYFGKTVAVKVNHKSELEIPANVGDYPLDGLEVVNTHNSKKLQAANDAIKRRHAELERRLGLKPRLGGLGLAVAKVIYDEGFAPRMQVRATDKSIAGAVRKLASR
jgi:hypothetical protein